MTEVKCKVKSCHYWGSGDICQADKIEVDNAVGARTTLEVGDLTAGTAKDRDLGSPRRGAAGAGMEIGDFGGTAEGRDVESLARTSREAICKTFRPKGSKPEGTKGDLR